MFSQEKSRTQQGVLDSALAILAEHFEGLGATALSLPFLYPGEELLDLYGEDLRARAFVYGGAERGDEMCLRPDFTVPVALAHREGGWARQAAYCYQGTVFRRQPTNLDRPIEYVQAGIERFGDTDFAATDASVFQSLQSALRKLGLRKMTATIGDLSIVLAVLDALEMPEFRRAALKRHIWRPKRFQSLIAKACGGQDTPLSLRVALEADPDEQYRLIENAGEFVGLRDIKDVCDRIETLSEQRNTPAMSADEAKLISDVLEVRGPAGDVVGRLLDLTKDAGVDIESALKQYDERLKLLTPDADTETELYFDAAFGRALEYYDGFVFELRLAGADEHPPLAGGGRYNTMTQRLGAAEPIPAIGGIVRPEAVLEAIS